MSEVKIEVNDNGQRLCINDGTCITAVVPNARLCDLAWVYRHHPEARPYIDRYLSTGRFDEPPKERWRAWRDWEVPRSVRPGILLRHKHNKCDCEVTSVLWDRSGTTIRMANMTICDLGELFERFEYLDGSPCGMKEEG